MLRMLWDTLSSHGFEPHGHCFLWTQPLLTLYVVSDTLIAVSYYSIPVALLYFVRKRHDLPFNWIFLAFGVFILACGTTHILDIWTIWQPDYWLDGAAKALTALASLTTAVAVWPLIPKALKLPAPSQLERVIQELQAQINERQRFEQALQEKNLELENVNLAKDRFLASMSHELRTPLNAVIGFTGILLMRLPGPLTDEQEKQLCTVQTSAKHLLSLINDLLDLAKIESGHVELRLEPVIYQHVVREVAATLRPLAEAKGLTFTAAVPESDLMVRTDRRALSQILINLATNAIKFTDTGSVRLALAQQVVGAQTHITLQVIDTGIGIRPEKQASLFQAFSQAESTVRYRQDGTGLGLYLSQKLAELLGGQIVFESTYGTGSTFTLLLVAD
jgi:signal transduction histidine kinase